MTEKEMLKHRGKIVEMIYLDRNHNLTQRQIRVIHVTDTLVKAACLDKQAMRTFRLQHILAVRPVLPHAG